MSRWWNSNAAGLCLPQHQKGLRKSLIWQRFKKIWFSTPTSILCGSFQPIFNPKTSEFSLRHPSASKPLAGTKRGINCTRSGGVSAVWFQGDRLHLKVHSYLLQPAPGALCAGWLSLSSIFVRQVMMPEDSQRWRNGWCHLSRSPWWPAGGLHCRAIPRRW